MLGAFIVVEIKNEVAQCYCVQSCSLCPYFGAHTSKRGHQASVRAGSIGFARSRQARHERTGYWCQDVPVLLLREHVNPCENERLTHRYEQTKISASLLPYERKHFLRCMFAAHVQ